MKEATFVDKSQWANGPWAAEPDRVEWRDTATGYPCLMLRHATLGHWCGYVAINPDHPLYEKDYCWRDENDEYCDPGVEVHGGLTFAAPCQAQDDVKHVCHTPIPGEPDNVWWFGFDCAHYGDLSPFQTAYRAPTCREVYKDVEFVKAEITSLAAQLKGKE